MGKKRIYGLNRDQIGRLLSLGIGGAEADGDEDQRAGSAPETPPEKTASLEAHTERPGGWVGRYRLLKVLGEGGMGMVFLAQQEQAIQRQVALKVIKPGMDSKRVIARFEAERQALALLDHPNIAQVYDAGTTNTGRPYFVMEYVKGSPITDYCDRHQLSIEDRLHLFQQVCLAVHHAHQKGIIHRDIKPSNILVSTEGDRAVPKIIDFGVAKAMSQPLTDRTLFTEDSHLLGTPAYMSPEQADMANEDIDTRSDVYSLGVLLYVLLSGILPYDSETFREGGVDHIRKVIRETDPKTPSTRLAKLGEEAGNLAENRRIELAALAKCLHRELEWIPLKAMRKDRAERYRSASELADDIENYLNSAPLIAGPPSAIYKLKKFVRRNRALVTGMAAVLVVLIVGIVVSTVLAVGQARARAEAKRQAKISEAVSNFLREHLASVDPIEAKGRELTVRSFLDTASENIEDKFENEPLVEASIRDTLGWTYRNLGDYDKAELHLERARSIYQEQLGCEDPRTLKSIWRLVWIYFEQGRYVEAERLAVKTFEVQRRVLGEEDEGTLEAMNTVAFAYLRMGHYAMSESLFGELLEICHRVLGEEHDTILSAKGNLPWVYLMQGRYDEAERLFEKALELQRRVWGEEHPWTLVRMCNLAGVYNGQGRYDEAERQYLRTLRIQQRVIGEKHVYTLWSMNGLARLYTDEGKYEEAGHQFVKTLETCRRILGEEHPDTLHNVNGLGVLRTKQKQYDQAEILFHEALKGRRRELGDDHPDTLETLNDFGVLRRAQEHYGQAESLLRQALDCRQRKLGLDHPDTLESTHELALVYVAQEDYDKAEPLLLDAYHGRETKLGPEHPHTIESLKQLVYLYESWNKPDEAKKWRAKLPPKEAGEE